MYNPLLYYGLWTNSPANFVYNDFWTKWFVKHNQKQNSDIFNFSDACTFWLLKCESMIDAIIFYKKKIYQLNTKCVELVELFLRKINFMTSILHIDVPLIA